MRQAGIPAGPHATPKGLRHSFGLHAIRSGVPLNLVQRWLGHARIETTAIYASAIGDEERNLARRAWISLELAISNQFSELEPIGAIQDQIRHHTSL